MLSEAVGWGEKDFEATETGLQNSLFSVCVVQENEIVGCGRVVGDGGIYFYIQDIIVLPKYQEKGFGKRIMDAVMHYLEAHAHDGAFVGLMAAKGASQFYEQYGFTERAPDRPAGL